MCVIFTTMEIILTLSMVVYPSGWAYYLSGFMMIVMAKIIGRTKCHVTLTLIILEMLTSVSILMMVIMIYLFSLSGVSFFLLLTFAVGEACLGLALLVYLTRDYSHELMTQQF